MNKVLLADVPSTAWRNGGGLTQELLAWPVGAAWRLRVSVAAITQPGAFSGFVGVQRWFAVLAGAGVVLGLPSGDITLKPGSEPLCFDGAAAPGCQLLDGPTQDLNFMLQAAAGPGLMQRALPATSLGGRTAWRGLFTADAATVEIDGGPQPLAAGTLLWSDDTAPSHWRMAMASASAGPAPRAWWLSLAAA